MKQLLLALRDMAIGALVLLLLWAILSLTV